MKKPQKVYLTFDMEWANDDVLEYFYSVLKKFDLAATILVTHQTKWLEIFRQDEKIELGIHPNFNNLLSGKEKDSDYSHVIKKCMEIVPEAKICRSHSMTINSLILHTYEEVGIKYDLNMFICPEAGTKVSAYKRGGVKIVPFIWEDDLWLNNKEEVSVQYLLSDKFDMPKVFNFHPIQIYLNSETLSRYNEAKLYNWETEKLQEFRNVSLSTYGVYDFFKDLIKQASEAGYVFRKIGDMG